jgi:DNA-binding NarL/FixJ family response regulator
MAVVALVDDLMFASRIREAAKGAGTEVKTVRDVASLLAACSPPPALVIVDLDSQRLPVMDAIAALRADAALHGVTLVGFFSHVNPERARAAQAAGCSRVMPRSLFVKELPALLGASG